MKQKIITATTMIKCPVCNKFLRIGAVDTKILGMCENKACESVLVFGDPLQVKFKL